MNFEHYFMLLRKDELLKPLGFPLELVMLHLMKLLLVRIR